MEDISDKIELIKSVKIVAGFWGVSPSELAGFVGTIVKPEKQDEWNEIVQEVEDFYKMSIEERASTMGFTVSKLNKLK